MKKNTKEWTVDTMLGKIAMVSWGDPSYPPILLVHGFMDSAATFIPLVEQLPDTYYYVGFDYPGHGKSDPYPPGIVVSQINLVEVIRLIVAHMKWDKFVYISHSMSFLIGVFYNHLFPGKIRKMVHFDPAPPLGYYYFAHNKPAEFYQYIYDTYYDGYKRFNAGSTKRLTYNEAVNLIAKNRKITEDQAKSLLSRSLVPVGDGKYKLSWDTRMKQIASVALSEETLYTIITQHAPPMLIFEASRANKIPEAKNFVANIFEKCRLIVPNFSTVTIKGGHNIHITNIESILPHLKDFLKADIDVSNSVKSKL